MLCLSAFVSLWLDLFRIGKLLAILIGFLPALLVVERLGFLQLLLTFVALAGLNQRASELKVSVGDRLIDADGGAQFLDASFEVAGEHECPAECKSRVKLLWITGACDFEKRQSALSVAFREVKIAQRERGAWIFGCATQDFE